MCLPLNLSRFFISKNTETFLLVNPAPSLDVTTNRVVVVLFITRLGWCKSNLMWSAQCSILWLLWLLKVKVTGKGK